MLKIQINKFPPAYASDGLLKLSIIKFPPTGLYLFLVIPGIGKACKRLGMHRLVDTHGSPSTASLFTACNMLKIKINKFPPAYASDGLLKMSIIKFSPTGFYLFLVIPGIDKACKRLGMHWLMDTHGSASTEPLFTACNMLKIKINKFTPATAFLKCPSSNFRRRVFIYFCSYLV
jgi:hypothetical protein